MSRSIHSHLFQIDELLQGGSCWTASQLGKELGVSARTVNRYILRLRDDFQAPVEGLQDGYRYASPFSLKPSQFSEKDLFALYAAESVLDQFKGSFLTRQIRDRIREVLGTFVDPVRREAVDLRQHLSFRISGTPSHEVDSLMELLECALLRAQIEMAYRSPGSEEGGRVVNPYAITNRDGVWYLIAYDHRRERILTFNVSRIRTFRKNGEPFERDPAFDLADHFRDSFSVMKGDRPEKVTIRFSADKAHFIREREYHPDQILTEREDGGLDYEVVVNEPEEMLHFVLGFGSGAEILGPAWLRDRIAAEAERVHRAYSQD